VKASVRILRARATTLGDIGAGDPFVFAGKLFYRVAHDSGVRVEMNSGMIPVFDVECGELQRFNATCVVSRATAVRIDVEAENGGDHA
jgi:hypothetical protein